MIVRANDRHQKGLHRIVIGNAIKTSALELNEVPLNALRKTLGQTEPVRVLAGATS